MTLPQQHGAFFVGTQGSFNIRRNASRLNDLFAWSIIFGGGQPECRTIGQRHLTLDHALPECSLSNNDSTFKIFQGTCDNFSTAGAQAVDKDRDRKVEALL